MATTTSTGSLVLTTSPTEPLTWIAAGKRPAAFLGNGSPMGLLRPNINKESVMTVEIFVRVAGLLKAEGVAVVFYGDKVNAVAVNKAIVVTDGDPMLFITDDIYYIASNNSDEELADEVLDLSDSGINNESDVISALQSAAQMALLVSEPGPVAARYLERLVADDEYADYVVTRSQRKALKNKKVA